MAEDGGGDDWRRLRRAEEAGELDRAPGEPEPEYAALLIRDASTPADGKFFLTSPLRIGGAEVEGGQYTLAPAASPEDIVVASRGPSGSLLGHAEFGEFRWYCGRAVITTPTCIMRIEVLSNAGVGADGLDCTELSPYGDCYWTAVGFAYEVHAASLAQPITGCVMGRGYAVPCVAGEDVTIVGTVTLSSYCQAPYTAHLPLTFTIPCACNQFCQLFLGTTFGSGSPGVYLCQRHCG